MTYNRFVKNEIAYVSGNYCRTNKLFNGKLKVKIIKEATPHHAIDIMPNNHRRYVIRANNMMVNVSATELTKIPITAESAQKRSANTYAFEKKYTTIDLFSGIGGIRLGFEMTGQIENIFSCEIDKHACEVYKNNFHDQTNGDITKIVAKELPKFDILFGGFPCQAFSIAGTKGGFNDTRGTLFFNVATIIKEKKPDIVFLENVKGLVSHKKGKTFETIINTLTDLGYNVHHKILNAAHFGLPQKRERVYIVAIRKDLKGSNAFDFPAGDAKEKGIEGILDKNVDAKYFLSQQYWNTLIAHKERHKNKGNGFGYQIIDHEKPANTIMCGGMGRERNLIIDLSAPINIDKRKTPINNKHVRTMTPREWARLQGFPETFILDEVNGHAYRQLGNCVVVPVINKIARRIMEKMNEQD